MIHLLPETYIHSEELEDFDVEAFEVGDIVVSQYCKVRCVYWCEIEEKKYLGEVYLAWYGVDEFVLSGHRHPDIKNFKFCKVVPDINTGKSFFISENFAVLGEVDFLVYEPQETRDVEYSWKQLGQGQSKSRW